MKTKDFALQIKAVESDGTFEGYASTFGGPPDAYGEVVEPGAFARSLSDHQKAGTKPLLLWQHNSSEPLGRWLELAEDGKGLRGKGIIEIEAGATEQRIHRHLKSGNIRGLSIGYREVEVEEAKNGKPRKLKAVDLVEASIVSFAANRRARVDAVKDALLVGEMPTLPEFERFLREAGFSKTQATAIASRGLAHLLRSESESQDMAKVMADLRAAAMAFLKST